MDKFRQEIDICDRELVKILKKRFEIVKKIGDFKNANNLPISDENREKKVIKKVRGFANENLTPDMIEEIFTTIILVAKKSEKNNFK